MAKQRSKKKEKLSESDWREVFRVRCLMKRGMAVTAEERALVDASWVEDQKRYSKMEPDIFDATVPFGSSTRARRDSK